MNYNNDSPLLDRVYVKLPFLSKTDANDTLVSQLVYENMTFLETIFGVRFVVNDLGNPIEVWSRVGNSDNYNPIQLQIIQHLTCSQVLATVATNQFNTESDPSKGAFLKKAQAGSANAEYEQFDLNKSLYASVKPMELIKQFSKQATQLAYQLGYSIDFSDPFAVALFEQPVSLPFIIVQ